MDDYNNMALVSFYKAKIEEFIYFKQFHLMAEIQQGRNPKTEYGGEVCCQEFEQWLIH